MTLNQPLLATYSSFSHQDIGQMDMYVRLFEDRMKTEGDNPTIGVILCTEKDQTIVKYSVLEENKQLFASKYRLILPTEDELRREHEWEKQIIREHIKSKGQAFAKKIVKEILLFYN